MTANTFTVGEQRIGAGAPVFIIAEIGVNHDGDEDTCARLIIAAADAGADAAKLQIIDADESYVAGTESHDVFKDRALSMQSLERLCGVARDCGIILFATPGDFPSLDRMLALDMPLIKISSGLLTNLPLIRRAAASGHPLILSSGMADIADIKSAVDAATQAGATGIAVLQCTSVYPTPPDDVNLRAMAHIEAETGLPVGYSDHCLGNAACLAATAMGASILEKHFSLDNTLDGADHYLSAMPNDLRALVDGVREVEKMMGSAEKKPTDEEKEKRSRTHRCLVARRDIAAGEELTEQNISLKRPLPGKAGLPASEYERVLGAYAANNLKTDQSVRAEDIKP